MALIKQKDNAKIVREEIHSIQEIQDASWPPLPFLGHFLMHSVWTSDSNNPEQFYKSGGSILPVSMGSTEGGMEFVSGP